MGCAGHSRANRRARRGLRRDRDRRYAAKLILEAIEPRILLVTYVINGTIGPDTWNVSADAGTVTVNGATVTQANITDVQVNGLDDVDMLTLEHTTIPVVFNGGNGSDQFSASNGLMTQEILAAVTFNGGAATDFAQLQSNFVATNTAATFAGNSVNWTTGSMTWDASLEFANLMPGPGGSTVSIGSLTNPVAITVNGNDTGSDQLTVAMNGSTAQVGYSGGNGTGVDSLIVTDNAIGPLTYTVNAGTVSRPGRSIFINLLESVSLTGTAASTNTFNVSGNGGATALSLTGGNASDSFNLTAAQYDNVTVAGGGGPADGLVVDDRVQPVPMGQVELGATTMSRSYTQMMATDSYDVTYAGIEAWTYFARNSSTSIDVSGVPSSIPAGQQATIICGGNADTVTLHPHDAAGNLTMNANLGVGGGIGADKVIIEDTGAANGINYLFTNTFGPGTQNVYGMCDSAVGNRGFGAGSDVETIEIRAGDGTDTFNLNTWQSGAALVVNSGDGQDSFNVSPTAKSVSAAITAMSFFSYDGGHNDGTGTRADSTYDSFTVENQNNASAWTITRTSTAISYVSGGYSLTLNLSNIGALTLYGGTQPDQFLIRSTPAQLTEQAFDGVGGNDTYTFGNLGLTSGIASGCAVEGFSGTDAIVVDDTADTTGRRTHIVEWLNGSIINNDPTDTLFPSAANGSFGSIFANQVTGAITVKLGSGADTVSLAPVVTGVYSIQGNNPTIAPGDRLMLGFAAVTTPIFTAGVTGAGSYTFGNRRPLSYTGIETKTTDGITPTVLAQHFDPSASSMNYQFSEDVGGGLYYTDFRMKNLTTNTFVQFEDRAYSFDAGTNTVHYTFPGLPGGVLPAGSYLATLKEATDQSGNYMVGEVSYRFIWSGGTSGPDAFRIAVNAAVTTTDVYQNDDITPAFTADFSSLDLIALNGGDDADTFTIDATNGNPYAISGIVLDGGNDSDGLTVHVTDLVDAVSFNLGTVTVDGVISTHSSVEAMTYSGGSSTHFLTLSVNAGNVMLTGTARFDNLKVVNGATATAAVNGVIIAHTFSIPGTGRLDLGDDDLIVTAMTYANVAARLKVGFGAGDWLGTGITSSAAAASPAPGGARTMLGIGDNAALHYTMFSGESLGANDVLVKYTYAGDADLNGRLDGDDYFIIDAHVNVVPPGSGRWWTGDFDYNDKINGDDYFLLDSNIARQGVAL